MVLLTYPTRHGAGSSTLPKNIKKPKVKKKGKAGNDLEIYYQKGPMDFDSNCFLCNSVGPRPWPGFVEIEPPALLTEMAGQLFAKTDSSELLIPTDLLAYCAELAPKVTKVDFNSVQPLKGNQNRCHFECCRIYNPDKHQFFTGFSRCFAGDAYHLSFHSWLMRGKELIETVPCIVPRESYWGKTLDRDEIKTHCKQLTEVTQKQLTDIILKVSKETGMPFEKLEKLYRLKKQDFKLRI
jgi:hypothetical protein